MYLSVLANFPIKVPDEAVLAPLSLCWRSYECFTYFHFGLLVSILICFKFNTPKCAAILFMRTRDKCQIFAIIYAKTIFSGTLNTIHGLLQISHVVYYELGLDIVLCCVVGFSNASVTSCDVVIWSLNLIKSAIEVFLIFIEPPSHGFTADFRAFYSFISKLLFLKKASETIEWILLASRYLMY